MLILLGLALLWAAVIVPPVVRNRDVLLRPMVTVAGAGRSLGRSGPRHLRAAGVAATSIPGSARSARRRRRDVMLVLAGFSAFTLLGGVAVGGAVWTVHFLVDIALVGYGMKVTQRHQLEVERRETVLAFRPHDPLMGGVGRVGAAAASSAMRDEAVLRRRAN